MSKKSTSTLKKQGLTKVLGDQGSGCEHQWESERCEERDSDADVDADVAPVSFLISCHISFLLLTSSLGPKV